MRKIAALLLSLSLAIGFVIAGPGETSKTYAGPGETSSISYPPVQQGPGETS